MMTDWPVLRGFGKMLMTGAALCALAACSTNPATGERQFTALMSPAQENQVGAQENAKVLQTYGIPENSQNLQAYVNQVGQRVAQDTERSDVQYKFTLLDSPMVNAFALPGGYVYVTRGLMALANSEAEFAGVVAHEIAHITGRHSAERYSQGVLTTLGAAALSIALDSNAASQALGVGSQLYMSSYSRGQESQADDLGIRYLHKAGYDTFAMASFLNALDRDSQLGDQARGQSGGGVDYFATHPKTADRVNQATAIAAQYAANQKTVNRNKYLRMIDGMVYGDSERQGFVRGQTFWHPQMGFTFTAPAGFTLSNQPTQVIAASKQTGAVIILDSAQNPQGADPLTYLTSTWMQGKPVTGAERIDINGKPAATASIPGTVQGQAVTIRLVAVQWAPDKFFRFQMAIPGNAGAALVDELKRATYSLRPMTAQEKQSIRPRKLKIVTAGAGDTAASLAARMAVDTGDRAQHFRVLNGLENGQDIQPGQLYKIVVE